MRFTAFIANVAILLSAILCGSRADTGNLRASRRDQASIPITPEMGATGGLLEQFIAPKILLINGSKPLNFPLDTTGIDQIKAAGRLSKIGLNNKEVMAPAHRTSYELHPEQVKLEGLMNQPAFQELLNDIQTDLEIVGTVEAHLYKFLLYEKGCFFRQHVDHKRLPHTVGTLVIEMPSIYKGGSLRVWPINDMQNIETFFSADSSASHLSYTAFLSGSYHEVTELTEGSRFAMVFTLTAPPTTAEKRQLSDSTLGFDDLTQENNDTLILDGATLKRDDYPSEAPSTLILDGARQKRIMDGARQKKDDHPSEAPTTLILDGARQKRLMDGVRQENDYYPSEAPSSTLVMDGVRQEVADGVTIDKKHYPDPKD